MSIIIIDKNSLSQFIRKINKKINSDNKESGTNIPSILPNDNFIILLRDTKSDSILSLIWYGIYQNDEFGKILHVNYSYTFLQFRNKGYNKLLRTKLELIGIENCVEYMTSCPFENSGSRQILIKLGYTNRNNFFYKKIII